MQGIFYNRRRELEFLLNKFQSARPELLIFRGRRRVGKTFLLQEFARKVNSLYFMGTISSHRDQLAVFSQTASHCFNDPLLKTRPFASWDEFFLYLHQNIEKRTAVIIDEYPYLVESYPGLSTILQKYWDEYFIANPNLFLVLNGSALSMMERETLYGKAPLYGRRTGQWLVKPFNVLENQHFFSTHSLIRSIEWYAISGGVPFYSQILSAYNTPLKAIEKEILTFGQTLFEEVEFLLRGEFRNPRSYFPILKAIALGSRKFGEISSKTGYDKANLTKYLSTLTELHLIRREVPITEEHPAKSKKGLFFLNDHFMNLWFRFVFPYQSELEAGQIKSIYEKIVKPQFDYFVSQVCETIIRELLVLNCFGLNFKFNRVGRFWNKNTEIDIFGYTEDDDTVAGEIKWSKSPVTAHEIKTLLNKQRYIASFVRGNLRWLFISKSGFEKAITKMHPEIILIDLKDYTIDNIPDIGSL